MVAVTKKNIVGDRRVGWIGEEEESVPKHIPGGQNLNDEDN